MSITIGISFYNAEDFLPGAIKSVFAQTHEDWELLLIDDGSTDKSLEIARSVYDPRVRVISDGKNMKLAYRLNQIIELAKYDYIARMDADDLMDPKRLEIQFKSIQNSGYDLISTGLYSVKNNLSLVGMRGEDIYKVTLDDIIHRRIEIVHASLLAKKSWYRRNRYDESLPVAQDYDLWLNALSRKDLNIKTVKDPLYIYREESSVSANKMLKAYSTLPLILRKNIRDEKLLKTLLFKLKSKEYIIKALAFLGLLHLLQKRRNSAISIPENHLINYKELLNVIDDTEVPGMSSCLENMPSSVV